MLDSEQSVSVEITPVGVFVIAEVNGSVQRTNHFQHETPLAAQRSEAYEPDSSQRLSLVRERLAGGLPADEGALVDLLRSGEGQPPLTCVPDMSLQLGERWATLATIVTDPERKTIRVLDGMPTEAATGAWRTLTV
jgi:isopenicillin-N N-acyltransferase-like protein